MSRDVSALVFLGMAAVSFAQGQGLRIAEALETLRPGETLTVPAGNYHSQGTIRVTVSGSPDSPSGSLARAVRWSPGSYSTRQSTSKFQASECSTPTILSPPTGVTCRPRL